uniref:t-SNARE coiled-coil homology domain-containing protein n=1 Tax=Angiostrongylus cantonensis TaxID=6313 RepID=A0A0K0CVP0_ANGCA
MYDITGLNKQIAALQEFSRRRGGTRNQGTGHSQLVVVGLQSKLASVSKDFQCVLEISTENLKHQKIRREKFSHAEPVPLSLPSSSSGSNGRIDSNVEDVAINIDAAHTELVKYFHTISKNRWLMIKVFGVLMVFFIVFVLFLT